MPLFEQFLPPQAAAPWLDRAVAAVLMLRRRLKALALSSLLFGAGLAIQFERLAGSGTARSCWCGGWSYCSRSASSISA